MLGIIGQTPITLYFTAFADWQDSNKSCCVVLPQCCHDMSKNSGFDTRHHLQCRLKVHQGVQQQKISFLETELQYLRSLHASQVLPANSWDLYILGWPSETCAVSCIIICAVL